MRKTIFISMFMFAGFCSAAFSQVQMTSSQYLEQYKDFVEDVNSRKDISPSQYHALDSVYDGYTAQYKYYKKGMTEKQIEEYNILKNRYRRSIMKYRTRRFGSKVEHTTDTIGSGIGKGVGSAEKGVRRTGAAVGGFFKGMFDDSDKKSDSSKK